VCHPTPGAGDRRSLALDLLVALGKDHDALARERLGPRAWPLARSWLVGEGVGDLFVLRAHLLGPERWRDLVSLPAGSAMRLWLVVHRGGGPTPGQLAALGPTGWDPVEASALAEQWPDGSSPSSDEEPIPSLPSEGFYLFRAMCRWTLPPEEFARVDAIYLRSRAQTLEWLRDWPEGAPLSRPAVHAFLQRLTADSPDAADALVRFRGAQAQLFRHGWLLWARGQESAFDPSGALVRLDRSCAARLRAIADPRAVALAAVSLLSESPLSALLSMAVGDATPGRVSIDGRRYAVPRWSEGLVATLVAERRRDGAGAGDPLFVARRGGRLGIQEASRLLAHVAQRSGIRFRPESRLLHSEPPPCWLSLGALRLVEIGEPPQRVTSWLSSG
jgi:hypothetical protein